MSLATNGSPPESVWLPLSVWLIDTQPLRRSGLRAHLAAAGFTIGADGATLTEARERAGARTTPSLIILDHAQGLRDVEEAVLLAPASRIVALADHMSLEDLATTFAAGAHGYLLRSIAPAALTKSLRLALAGEKVFPSELSELLAKFGTPFAETEAHAEPIGGVTLSAQELQITRRIAEGFPNKTIAQSLAINESTVKAQVKNLLRKIGASNRTQAALWAHQHGIGVPRSRVA